MPKWTSLVAASLLAVLPIAAFAGTPVRPARAELPVIRGPIAITATSRPWAASIDAVEPIDLARRGFVEEEYFVAGEARVLDWPKVGALTELARGPYVTRILVRRPANPKHFSGTVVVEPLNPSVRYDAPLIWGSSHDHFLRHGDIWVGVTVKPVAIGSLKEFDHQRYAPLGFPNPMPPDRTCGQDKLPMPRGGLPPESTPATENGLMWDALSQVGALFKAGGKTNPFAQFQAKRLYMAGDSQSGGFVFNYAEAVHPFVLSAKGRPLWDGYVATVASGPGLPMHQCADAIPRGDPRLELRPVGVPLIGVASQSEIRSLRRRPDSDRSPDLFRGYEVAGASHIHDGDDAGTPAPQDIARTGGAGFVSSRACRQDGMPGNDVPIGFVLNAVFANLEEWSEHGKLMPKARAMAVIDPGTPEAALETDAEGNVRGGVRTPQLDVPLATYHERMDGPGICELWGWRDPLPKQRVLALYGDRQGYLAKFRSSVGRLVKSRWLEGADGNTLIARAKRQRFP